MVQLQDGLAWLLNKRFNCKRVTTLSSELPIKLLLTDAVSYSYCAVVVDEIRVHTLQELAVAICDAHKTRKRNTLKCIIVYQSKCTLKNTMQGVTVKTDQKRAVHFSIFSEAQICNHPLQYSIVPHDYRRVHPDSPEMQHLCAKINSLDLLPRMLTTDAVAHLLGFVAGDVVAFTNCMGSLPPEIKYRIVVTPET